MTVKQPNNMHRYLLSPAMMWTAILLACLAWLLHTTPLLTPLWSDNASLGHGICIELAPVVSAAHNHSMHSQHHSDASMLAPSETAAQSAAVVNSKTITTSKHDTHQHSSCDICTSMSAVITPLIIESPEFHPIEITTIVAMIPQTINAYYATDFLRPFSRAPPSFLMT
ncbi:MAG: hypothetical protein ACTH7W_04300 [Psychrobacter sp.]|uniref:hypothetical protein n=1 Tax=unclassified Psychrobacter TaxID=196806 RepID=UPI0017881341|nr:hypothetical protein [Psychrobacter sp. FME13]MBE0442336.1 hypothetical protein [Psychrobacter sp. FME13]